MKRSIRGHAVVLVLAFIAAACGTATTTTTTTTQAASTDSTVDSGSTTTQGSTETTTSPEVELAGEITVWRQAGPGELDALTAQAARFMELHPDVIVNTDEVPFETVQEQLRAALTAGSGPDVWQAGSGGWLTPVADGLRPIDDLVTPEMMTELAGWHLMREGYEPEGPLLGVPNELFAYGVFYNKQQFTDAGLDPNTPPTTYTQLLEAAEALKSAGFVPLAGGNAEGYETDFMFATLLGGIVDTEGAISLATGEMPWTGPEMTGLVQRYADLVENGQFDEGMTSRPLGEAFNFFPQGGAAMFPAPFVDSFYQQMLEGLGDDNVGFSIGLAVDGDTPKALPIGAGRAWVIPTYSEEPELAFEFIKFLTSVEGNQIRYDAIGLLGNRSGVVLSEDAPEPTRLLSQLLDESLGPDATGPGLLGEPQGLPPLDVFVELRAQMQLVFVGETTVTEALEAVQAVQEGVNG